MVEKQLVDQVARDTARDALSKVELQAALAQQARQASMDKMEEARREVREANARLEASLKELADKVETTTLRLVTRIDTVAKSNNLQFWSAAIALIGALASVTAALVWKIVFP